MAPPAPRECNQPARSALHRNQFAAHRLAHRIPCSAAHCIAPVRSASLAHRIPCSAAHCLASRASQRIASHPVQRSAPRECNQPARSAAHRKQSAHRTTSPPRIAHRAR
jgi:hypothetical protein